jgi:hypothetical protein
VPGAALVIPEAKKVYTNQILEQARASAARGGVGSVRVADGHTIPESPTTGQRIARRKQAALKIYAVDEDSQRIAGVPKRGRRLV